MSELMRRDRRSDLSITGSSLACRQFLFTKILRKREGSYHAPYKLENRQ